MPTVNDLNTPAEDEPVKYEALKAPGANFPASFLADFGLTSND